jgi:hypothetical protein
MRTRDASIDALVARLGLPARGWVVVDHWEGDLYAIGIASAQEPARLVYVSTFGNLNETFDYECELPPTSSEELYRVAREGKGVSFEELLKVMVSHLDDAPSCSGV